MRGEFNGEPVNDLKFQIPDSVYFWGIILLFLLNLVADLIALLIMRGWLVEIVREAMGK